MKIRILILTFYSISFSFSQESVCNQKYEYEILEKLDSIALQKIESFYLNKVGICDVKLLGKSSELVLEITTRVEVDKKSIDLLTLSAFKKYNVKSKHCEHE